MHRSNKMQTNCIMHTESYWRLEEIILVLYNRWLRACGEWWSMLYVTAREKTAKDDKRADWKCMSVEWRNEGPGSYQSNSRLLSLTSRSTRNNFRGSWTTPTNICLQGNLTGRKQCGARKPELNSWLSHGPGNDFGQASLPLYNTDFPFVTWEWWYLPQL